MKIICKKGYDARKVLQLATEYIKKKSLDYPLLAEDMEIEISLKDIHRKKSPENDSVIYLGKKAMDLNF